jgi:ribosomal-protein-alanine N-acetyltransferase
MITTSEYTLRDVQISLQPSAKEMMGMDSLCFTSPWNEQDYLEMQKQPAFNNWLLDIPAVCSIGMLAFQSIPPELEILRLGVHPGWRKRGFAEFMLEQLEILAKSDRIESLWLEVHAANKSAVSLYSKLAYKETGSRKNYYRNPSGDALLFKKLLKHDTSLMRSM